MEDKERNQIHEEMSKERVRYEKYLAAWEKTHTEGKPASFEEFFVKNYEDYSKNLREKLYKECIEIYDRIIYAGRKNVAENVFLSISTLHSLSILADMLPQIVSNKEAKALMNQTSLLETVYKQGWMESDYYEPRDYVFSEECKDFIKGIVDWTLSSKNYTENEVQKILSQKAPNTDFSAEDIDILASSNLPIMVQVVATHSKQTFIPLEDYLEIQALNFGFDSYDDLRKNGLHIPISSESIILKESLTEKLSVADEKTKAQTISQGNKYQPER